MENRNSSDARTANIANAKNLSADQAFELSTEQFAAFNQVKAQSVRSRLCTTGSYFGVVPRKLANGRLAFPAIQVAI